MYIAAFTQKRLQREAEERLKQEERKRQMAVEKQRRRESLNNTMPMPNTMFFQGWKHDNKHYVQ